MWSGDEERKRSRVYFGGELTWVSSERKQKAKDESSKLLNKVMCGFFKVKCIYKFMFQVEFVMKG